MAHQSLGETFLRQLPVYRLSPGEQRLKDALQECVAAAEALRMPADITVQQWAERRVPDEALQFSALWHSSPGAQQGGNRRKASEMQPHGDAKRLKLVPSSTHDEYLHEQRGDNSKHEKGNGKGLAVDKGEGRVGVQGSGWQESGHGNSSGDIKGKKGFGRGRTISEMTRERAIESFFSGLPEEALTQQESCLRDALVDFVMRHEEANPGIPPKVSEANSKTKGDQAVRQCCEHFLPTGVGLREWMNHRIGGELEAVWDDERQCSVIVASLA